jgi:hypothetical protein
VRYFSGNTYLSIKKIAATFVAFFLLSLRVSVVSAGSIGPLAANNGLYLTSDEWPGLFRVPNYVYPEKNVSKNWSSPVGRLSTLNAKRYMHAIKADLAPTLAKLW